MYLVDTSTWIEIFQDTEKGKKSAKLLKESRFFTASVSIAEISKWCYLNSIDFLEIISKIENASLILYTTRTSEQMAGRLWVEVNKKKQKKEKQVGLIDCIVAAIAEENDFVVLTKDRHFEKFDKIKKELI